MGTMMMMGGGRSSPVVSGGGGGGWDASSKGTIITHQRFTDSTKVKNSSAADAADNEAIDTIQDSGPNAILYQQTTSSNRPTCKTNIVNGKQIARFDAGDGFGFSDANSGLITKNRTGLTLAFVGNFSSLAATQRILRLDGPSALRLYIAILTGGGYVIDSQPQDGGSPHSEYSSASYLMTTGEWNVSVFKIDFAGNAMKAWINNDLVIDSADIGSSGNSSNTNTTSGIDGNHFYFNGYGSGGFVGDVGELVIWDGALADLVCTGIVSDLLTEYAITP